jgi:nucleoside triphosphate pyrophosphatase
MNRPGGQPRRLVLGSRSPRRLELLRQIHPAELIEVCPPTSTAESDFENLHDWPSIERRLLEIAGTKCDDVATQVRSRLETTGTPRIVIAADTVVVVERSGGSLHVLGQPPSDDSWSQTVRRWFREDYAGKPHIAATALCLERLSPNDEGARQDQVTRVVTSKVTFVDDVDRWLDWYLATAESRGKAGGYALQGAGSIFISKVEGSLSNVVGLPLAELLEMFAALPPS